MDHTVQSLVYVVEQGAARVRKLSDSLQSASPKQLEPILRTLGKEADTLSGGLARLSHHVESMPSDEDKTNAPPDEDRRLLEISALIRNATNLGFCGRCGGTRRGL